MNRSWVFRLHYLFGRTPWDTGISPPELVAVVEGDGALPPGAALDIGCGTGTNVVYLARHGWDVTGVDFIPTAIRRGRRRSRDAGVAARLIAGDVTRLRALRVDGPFDLLLDLGCFHSIPVDARDAYVAEMTRVARPGATFLLFAFAEAPGPPCATPDEIRRRFGQAFEVVDDVLGKGGREPHWYRLRRRGAV